MDQRQGGSPPVYPATERNPRAPEDAQVNRGSSTYHHQETLHNNNHHHRHHSSSSNPLPSPFPQYTSPIPPALSTITVTASPSSTLSRQQQHRDSDRLDVAARRSPQSVDGDGHTIDPWPRNYSSHSTFSVSSSSTFQSPSHSPFGRPVVFDRGTFDPPNVYQEHANPGEPGENRRIQELASNYEERMANRREDDDDGRRERARPIPGAAGALPQRNGSSPHHPPSPLHSYPRAHPHHHPHHPLSPHESGSQSVAAVARVDSSSAHNRRHNDRIDSLDRRNGRATPSSSSNPGLDSRSYHPFASLAASSPPPSASSGRWPPPSARMSTSSSSSLSSSPSLHRSPSSHVFSAPAAARGEDRAAADSPYQQQRLAHASYASPHVVDRSSHGPYPRGDGEHLHNHRSASFSMSPQRPSAPFVAPHSHQQHPSRSSAQSPEDHPRHHSTGHIPSHSQQYSSLVPTSSSPLPPPRRASSPPPPLKSGSFRIPSLKSGPFRRPFDDHNGEAAAAGLDQQQQQRNRHSDHDDGHDDDDYDDEQGFESHINRGGGTLWQRNSPHFNNLRYKFGTDMPTTVDLKSAIDTCDILCDFALHYAIHDQDEFRQNSGYDDRSIDPHYRATLQKIRNMNSIILTGLQTPGSNPNPGRGTAAPAAPNGESNPQAGEPHQSNDSPMAEGGMDPENEDDERPSRFGPGPPSSEMVHELAKAATSIFQLAIRIKAWVGMTPEERELDEEINIIRGKRCLFMDGSTSMPLPGPDTQGHHRQGNEWASGWGGGGGQPRENGYTDQYDRSRNFDRGSSGQQQNGFRRNGDHGEDRRGVREQDQGSRSQFETPYGSYKSVTSLQGGMAASFAEKGLTRTKSSPCIKALGSDTGGDAPHQKYRKRAKRTHPPGRCLSCDSSDTPEWRRGPDGPRTLCNACGLHYAKLMKRQNEQQKTLNGGQGGSAGLGLITTTVLQSSLSQLQGINFQFRRRPNSLTPPVNMVTAAGAGTGAGAGAGPESRPDTAASVEEIEVDEDES